MGIDDARGIRRRRQARKEFLRDPWRQREDHRIVRAERSSRVGRSRAHGALALEADRPEAVAEANRDALRGEIGERRIDEGRAEAVRGEQRMAGLSARAERLAQESRGERRGAFRRIGVERRSSSGRQSRS